MKAKAKFISGLTLGVTLGLAVWTQVAHAADFNPQPDPPVNSAKSLNSVKSKGLHNPPGDKGTLIDPNTKGSLVDPNERAAKGAVIGPNDKGVKGAVIGPNDKSH